MWGQIKLLGQGRGAFGAHRGRAVWGRPRPRRGTPRQATPAQIPLGVLILQLSLSSAHASSRGAAGLPPRDHVEALLSLGLSPSLGPARLSPSLPVWKWLLPALNDS